MATRERLYSFLGTVGRATPDLEGQPISRRIKPAIERLRAKREVIDEIKKAEDKEQIVNAIIEFLDRFQGAVSDKTQ